MNNIYKCDTCGNYFTKDEILIYHETNDNDLNYYYDTEVELCPFCRGTSFKKGSICKVCKKFVSYDLTNEDNICDDCYYDNLNKSGEENE